MIGLRQHVPAFVDGVDPRTIFVEDQDALLAHPLVDVHTDPALGSFYRFSLSHLEGAPGPLLMAEYDRGTRWWVVGYVLDGADQLTLPDWQAVRA